MTILTSDGRSFRKACEYAGVTFWQAYDKIRIYGMSPDEAIRYCQKHKGIYKCHGMNLRQYCITHDIPYQCVLNYHYLDTQSSFEDIVDKKLYKKQPYTDTQFCKDNGINYKRAKERYYYSVYRKDYDKNFREFCKDCYKL
jgi:hypothetical protein